MMILHSFEDMYAAIFIYLNLVLFLHVKKQFIVGAKDILVKYQPYKVTGLIGQLCL